MRRRAVLLLLQTTFHLDFATRYVILVESRLQYETRDGQRLGQKAAREERVLSDAIDGWPIFGLWREQLGDHLVRVLADARRNHVLVVANFGVCCL